MSDLYRVYLAEWVVGHVMEAPAAGSTAEILADMWAYFDLCYAGRVRHEDVQVVLDTQPGVAPLCQLLLRLPVLKGETKHLAAAEAYMAGDVDLREHGILVVRNSKEDHELRNYGITMLPADG